VVAVVEGVLAQDDGAGRGAAPALGLGLPRGAQAGIEQHPRVRTGRLGRCRTGGGREHEDGDGGESSPMTHAAAYPVPVRDATAGGTSWLAVSR